MSDTGTMRSSKCSDEGNRVKNSINHLKLFDKKYTLLKRHQSEDTPLTTNKFNTINNNHFNINGNTISNLN